MSHGNLLSIEELRNICVSALDERHAHALLDRVLGILAGSLCDFRGAFYLRHGDVLSCASSLGTEPSDDVPAQVALGEGVIGRVASSSFSEVFPQVSFRVGLAPAAAPSAEGTACLCCVPMRHSGQVMGVLSVLWRPSETDAEEVLAGLETAGELVAMSLAVRSREEAEREAMRRENRTLQRALDSFRLTCELLGNSHAMKRVHAQIRAVAGQSDPVLICGSCGTGKELVARTIWKYSERGSRPFEAFAGEGLTESAVEDALLGPAGLLKTLAGGTVYVTELCALPLSAQAALAAYLADDSEGAVRILAGTQQDVDAAAATGTLLAELLERLVGQRIELPDLKDRRSDIMLLTEHFIQQFNQRYNKQVRRLSTPSINMLVAYHWPGNVRELENCLEHAVLSAMDDTIHGYNLPAALQLGGEEGRTDDAAGADFNTKVASYERELIIDALKQANGKMSAAAGALGISPRVMHYKVRLHGIIPEWYKKNS